MSRNQFAGICFRCGKLVPPKEGHFERVGRLAVKKYGALAAGKKWIVQHADCAIEHRGSDYSITKATGEA
jgi:hypothetical protein